MAQHDHYNEHSPFLTPIFERGFEGILESIQLLLNSAMKIEQGEALNAHPFERSEGRKGYANGYKNKTVHTRYGKVDLDVPQVRGDISFYPNCIEKGLCSERALNAAICEMYIQGVSTRKVEPILKKLTGAEVSRQKVSCVTKELDEVLEKWRNRNLDWVRYMIVDARYEKVRVDGLVRDCALLTAYGVLPDGKRSVLGVSVSLSEAECHWRDFFRSLKKRGIGTPEFIVSDAHAGLKGALKTEFSGALWQRCQFHLQQNAGSYVPRKDDRKTVAEDIRSIFNTSSLDKAQQQLEEVATKYEKSNSKLSSWLRDNIPESFSVFNIPTHHRRYLRTSNMAEVINREIKRRTRVIGIFPNEESLLRIASALLKELDERWIGGRTYLNMEEC